MFMHSACTTQTKKESRRKNLEHRLLGLFDQRFIPWKETGEIEKNHFLIGSAFFAIFPKDFCAKKSDRPQSKEPEGSGYTIDVGRILFASSQTECTDLKF